MGHKKNSVGRVGVDKAMTGMMLDQLLYWIYSRRLLHIFAKYGGAKLFFYMRTPEKKVTLAAAVTIEEAIDCGEEMWNERA
jgi:hypothetical protein